MNIFQILIPLTYWLLVLMWAYILFFLMRRLRFRRVESSLIITLTIVLAIDAFSTLFDSIYFGAWYTSLAGFLPIGVYDFLVRTEMVIIPRFLNVTAAVLIIGIFLYRWLPAEERDRKRLEYAITEHTAELGKNNEQLQQEITARRQAEELYRTLAESSPVGVYIIQGGKFRFVNAQFQKYTGFSQDELSNMDPFEIIHPEDRERVRNNVVQMLKGNLSRPYEFRVVLRDGETHWAMETVVSIYYEGERATLGNFMDITERKKMQEQLIATERMASIGELASGIAHELNNPLTGVISFSNLLLEKDLPDGVKEDLKIINGEAQRTARVVRNLLTFARKQAPAKEPVKLNKVIESVMELRAYEMRVNNIQVTTQFASDLPEVTADAFQLQQVFINIIINAEYFMTEARRKGTLTITTEQIENAVRASFKDDGPGIAEEHLGYLFDPFFTTKGVGKGTGLGLSICRGIVTEHGGKIYAESEPGRGAIFIVELPVNR